MRRFFIFVIFILIFCFGNDEKDPSVARVGNKVLTLEMMNNVLNPDNSPTIEFDEKKDYIDRWVERELLYKEAEKRGLKDDPFIRKEILRLEKEMVIDRLLELEIDGKLRVTDDEIKDYYTENSEYYKYTENQYKYEHIKVRRLSEARAVDKALKADKKFIEISREVKNVSFVSNPEKIVFFNENNIPSDILKIVSSLEVGTWRRNKITGGYQIIKLIDKRNKGDIKELNLVKNEIVFNILAKKRKERYNQLVNGLRDNAEMEINYSEIGFLGDETYNIPDTLNSQNKEEK